MPIRADENSPIEPFIGSWTLISFDLVSKSGEVLEPMGKEPIGRIIYQRNGQMSAQLMRSAPAPFASADALAATPEETDRAWRDYLGYWGTFTVDAVAAVVVHHVEGSSFPNWIGQDQTRSFRFEEDRLILTADSPAWTATLRWRRID